MRMSVSPARTASSTTYWIAGLSRSGSISLGWAFVAGRNLVPSPAAGMTAFLTFMGGISWSAGSVYPPSPSARGGTHVRVALGQPGDDLLHEIHADGVVLVLDLLVAQLA